MRRINKLQVCDAQRLRIFDELEDGRIDATNLPASLPPESVGWYAGMLSDSTKVVTYQDFVTDASYNYLIEIQYESPGPYCMNNPIRDCNCITVYKTDKFGNAAADNLLPGPILDNAKHTLPMVEVCDDDENELFAELDGKKIDASRLPYVADLSTVTVDGWYRTTDPVTGKMIVVYVDKSTDPEHDYEIDIYETDNEISSCLEIETESSDKSGYPAVIPIPSTVKARAIATLPVLACGTGLWNGCTLGIPNKYIITGGALAGLYYFALKK